MRPECCSPSLLRSHQGQRVWRHGLNYFIQRRETSQVADVKSLFTVLDLNCASRSDVRGAPPCKQQIPQMDAALGTSFFSLNIFYYFIRFYFLILWLYVSRSYFSNSPETSHLRCLSMFSAVNILKAVYTAFYLDGAAGKTQVTLMATAVWSVSWRGGD